AGLRARLRATGTEEAAPGGRPRGGAVSATSGGAVFRDWCVAGEAPGARPSRSGDLLLQADASRPVRLLVAPGLAHSALVSGRLQGALRSPTFVLSKKQIHYRVSGRQGRINLIVDGYHLIREPIYGAPQPGPG